MTTHTHAAPVSGEQRAQDDALAAFTDALLRGQVRPEAVPCEDTEGSGRPPLGKTVASLARALSPQPPPDRLRSRVRRCVVTEWRPPRPALSQQILQAFRRPARRWVWAAAGALAALALAIALLLPRVAPATTGTAVGSAGVAILAVVLVLAAVLVVAWLILRRRH